MKYNNCLATQQPVNNHNLAQPVQLCQKCQQPLSVPPPRKAKKKHLWIDPLALLDRTQALALAQQAVEWTDKPQLSSRAKAGRKPTYRDATVLFSGKTLASFL